MEFNHLLNIKTWIPSNLTQPLKTLFYRKLMRDPLRLWFLGSKTTKRKSLESLIKKNTSYTNNLIREIKRKSLPSVSRKVLSLMPRACQKCSPEISNTNLMQLFVKNCALSWEELGLEGYKKLRKISWIFKGFNCRGFGEIARTYCVYSVRFGLCRCLKRDAYIVSSILEECRSEFKALISK